MSSFIRLDRVAKGTCGECVWQLTGSRLVVRPSAGRDRSMLSSTVGKTGTWPWLVFGSIEDVEILPGVVAPSKTVDMFRGLRRLRKADVSGLDTSRVRDLSGMFAGCSSLESVDLSGLDLMALSHVDTMFEGCSALTSIRWAASSPILRSAKSFLAECSSLESADLTFLGTSTLVNVSHLLSGCVRLRHVILDGWERTRLVDTSFMFDDCRLLTDVDISSWDLSEATNMSFMFAGCASMVRIPAERWDVRKCLDMAGMFSGCASLRWLNLSRWRPSPSVKSMHYMFAGSRNLFCVSLDGWELADVAVLTHAFDECLSLRLLSLRHWSSAARRALRLPRGTKVVCGYV